MGTVVWIPSGGFRGGRGVLVSVQYLREPHGEGDENLCPPLWGSRLRERARDLVASVSAEFQNHRALDQLRTRTKYSLAQAKSSDIQPMGLNVSGVLGAAVLPTALVTFGRVHMSGAGWQLGILSKVRLLHTI